MGIRGFSAAVSRYGILLPLNSDIVIDGPALVHRISEYCMRYRPPSSGFAALPPYATLNRMVICWLNELKSHNVNVRRIYFDGYLPPSKWEVRKTRLLRQSRAMRAMISSYPTGSAKPPGNPHWHVQGGLHLTSDVTFKNTTRKPPFLIPAVLEALRHDQDWGPLVKVVPGEADMFCAQDVRENGGTLITSDSDLLVQDLGLEGNVVFFWTIVEGAKTVVKAQKMSLHHINRQLGIENLGGLPRVAFEMQRSDRPWGDIDFDIAVQNAKQDREDTLNSPAYRSFMEELEMKHYVPSHHPVLSPLSNLDPRISEVVIQTLLLGESKSTTSEKKALRGPETLSMFLPVLIENRNSLSAWTQSTDVRQLAYSFLQTFARRRAEWIIEYRTLDSLVSQTGRRIRIPDQEEIVADCVQLVALLEKLNESFSSTSHMQWLAFAVYWDIRLSTSEKSKITSATLVRSATSQPNTYSWDLIHFTAQVHGHLYSLRIMKQILDVVFAMDQDLPAPVQQLHNCLASLPLITEWPTIENMSDTLIEFDQIGGLAITADIAGVPKGKLDALRCIRKKMTEKKEREKKKKIIKVKKPVSTNPYSILDQENIG